MMFDEFISVITSDFADALDEKNASAFIAAADIDTLHAALHTSGIKKKFVALINESLSKKIPTANTAAAMRRIVSNVSTRKGPK